MSPAVAISLIVTAFLGCMTWVIWSNFRARRARRSLMARRLDSVQRNKLIRSVALYGQLPPQLQDKLDGLIHLFLDDKTFEPCGGLEEVTLEMRITIATQACILILGHECKKLPYPGLRSILVYPDAYTVHEEGQSPSVRLGESWNRGTVVLAWKSVLHGGVRANDGDNVTFHEFAHQLDSQDHATDGAPPLNDAFAYRAWSAAFSSAWKRFTRCLSEGQPTIMNAYGATNHAEFFAVMVENFFERPRELSRKHPEAYAQLCCYFRLDPLAWSNPSL